tara:strand:- start:1714 stop:2166 length:453 start_codon:yes stop_codon:yes gene_type:complete
MSVAVSIYKSVATAITAVCPTRLIIDYTVLFAYVDFFGSLMDYTDRRGTFRSGRQPTMTRNAQCVVLLASHQYEEWLSLQASIPQFQSENMVGTSVDGLDAYMREMQIPERTFYITASVDSPIPQECASFTRLSIDTFTREMSLIIENAI